MSVNEIAASIGITGRYTYQLLSDLERAGYIRRRRNGRRNHYEISPELDLGDPLVEERPLRQLIGLVDTRPHAQASGAHHKD